MKHVAALLIPLALAACSTTKLSPATTTYGCDGTITVITAGYDNSDARNPTATVYLEDEAYPMHITPSASGARYASKATRNEPQFIWWTKGNSAILYQIAAGQSGAYAYEQQLATCIVAGQPGL